MGIKPSNGSNVGKFIIKVLDFIADPVFVKDRQHRWIYLNKAYCKFMGQNEEGLIGKTDYDFFPKAEADVFWEKDEIVFNTKEENVNEESFTDSKGVSHIIVTKKVLIRTEDEEEFIVGIIRDVTDQKRVEAELYNKMHDLEIFNKAAVNRELKMIELKNKITRLESQLKQG